MSDDFDPNLSLKNQPIERWHIKGVEVKTLQALLRVARAAKERNINAERWDRGPDWTELDEALKELPEGLLDD